MRQIKTKLAQMATANLDVLLTKLKISRSINEDEIVPSIGIQIISKNRNGDDFKMMNVQCRRSYLESLISKNNAEVGLISIFQNHCQNFIIDYMANADYNKDNLLQAVVNLLSLQPLAAEHLDKNPNESLGFSMRISGSPNVQTSVISLDFLEWVTLTNVFSNSKTN